MFAYLCQNFKHFNYGEDKKITGQYNTVDWYSLGSRLYSLPAYYKKNGTIQDIGYNPIIYANYNFRIIYLSLY